MKSMSQADLGTEKFRLIERQVIRLTKEFSQTPWSNSIQVYGDIPVSLTTPSSSLA